MAGLAGEDAGLIRGGEDTRLGGLIRQGETGPGHWTGKLATDSLLQGGKAKTNLLDLCTRLRGVLPKLPG